MSRMHPPTLTRLFAPGASCYNSAFVTCRLAIAAGLLDRPSPSPVGAVRRNVGERAEGVLRGHAAYLYQRLNACGTSFLTHSRAGGAGLRSAVTEALAAGVSRYRCVARPARLTSGRPPARPIPSTSSANAIARSPPPSASRDTRTPQLLHTSGRQFFHVNSVSSQTHACGRLRSLPPEIWCT